MKGYLDEDWLLLRYVDSGIKYREYRALFYEGH
jgi:hypothetical protein